MKLQAVLCLLLLLVFELSSCRHFEVIPGSNLELPCLSFQDVYTGGTITWKFNGEDLSLSAQSPDSPRMKKGGMVLSVSPVTAASQGEYSCTIEENNLEMSSTYTIEVVHMIYTMKVTQGSTAQLQCHFPTSSQVTANALWFKVDNNGTRTQLDTEDESSDNRVNLLYPLDHDQTITIKNIVMEDSGNYLCESAGGQTLSSVYIIVQVAPTPVPHSCLGFTAAWEPCQDENSRTGEPILQESITEFSMKLYSYLRESQPSSNLLFSPISISGVLSHLLLGARDNTRRAIETAVSVPHDFHCVHLQMKKLREKLAGSLQMASQIYYNPYNMNLSESFTNQSIQFYEAKPTRLLETSEENTQMINSWVANKTNNKIQHLVDSVSPNTQMMLLNAVSFSGQWKVKYDMKPRKGLFTKLDGDMVSVPILYHSRYMAATKYVVELKAHVARLALTGDNSLYILLPRSNKVSDLQQLEEKMTDTAVRQVIEQLKTTSPQRVEVTLPKIKLQVEPDMNLLIKKLGLSLLFENPNLCGLYSEDRIALDDARHRAFLALTEQGVEAGAATSMAFSRSFSSFSALRPFIMLLWSDQANVPLFVGRVTNP
ncbi:plasma protease C1 inhibitor [Epinephelus lanceolatus]|uniref:plasma protease C1 inhibitor n=1 Tax=Epinephelus lanceolatus TaxID=310571 RepID=UPI0014455FF9|nr:plasma protease C1 inhibitor [Epinephelus lanceolatus]XP_033478863.1 plasma protease C1 inhibitor [Epinephelus lanceolatus]